MAKNTAQDTLIQMLQNEVEALKAQVAKIDEKVDKVDGDVE